MDQIYPDAGLVPLLLRMVTPSVVYRLFTNNTTPALTDTVATYTQAAWGGYAPQTVPASAFILTGVTAHIGGITAPAISFLNGTGSGVTCYGYYITDVAGTTLFGSARFDAAPVVIASLASQLVIPTFGDFSQLTS